MPGVKSHFVNTDYNGAAVSNDIAAQLRQQPAAELLRFTQQGDKTVVQSKLPEKGAYGDPPQVYDIRVNMNYLMRGIARSIMGPDGGIDPKKADELGDWAFETIRAGKVDPEAFMDKFGIPKDPKRREDFRHFLAANGIGQNGVNSFLFGSTGPFNAMIKETFSQLSAYQLAVSGKQGPEAKEYAQGYQVEYEQLLAQYRDMANMEPETEQRVLVPMDCIGYANMNEHFISQLNAYREAKGLNKLSSERKSVAFENEEPVHNEKGEPVLQDKYNAFDAHHYVTLPVTINGQESVLTLEATAPPDGDLFHRRDTERTGIGIFPTAGAAEQYHRDNNLRQADVLKGIPGARERALDQKLKSAGLHTQGKPDAPQITQPKRSYLGYFLAHTGPRTGRMNAKQLAEAASKAIMASYFMNDPKAPAFSTGTLRKAAGELRANPQFLAVLSHMGAENVRRALTSGKITDIAARMYDDPDARYKIEDASKRRLRELGESMKTEKRSPEWTRLKRALSDPDMKNSMDVIDAVERYTKGKKSVRRTREGRESFDLAMKALAIAAKDGDDVAKQRAKILANRINAVRGAQPGSEHFIDLAALARPENAAQAGAFDAERYLANLDPGPKNPKVDLWVKTVADVYKPIPTPNERTMNAGSPGYTMEQFRELRPYDVKKLPVGGEPVGDEEFTALTAFAMDDEKTGGSYVHNVLDTKQGYCRVAPGYQPCKAMAHSIAFTAAFTDLGSQGGYGIRGIGSMFREVGQPARERVYDALRQYRQGNKQPLGALIGQGVDDILQCKFSTSDTNYRMADETMTLLRFANAAVKLAQRDPELRRIAERNGMTKENLHRIAGVQRFDTLGRIAAEAKKKLTGGENLSPEEKRACVTAILRCRAVGEHQNAEARAKTKELNEKYPMDEIIDLDIAIRMEKDPEKQAKLKVEREYRNQVLCGNALAVGTPPTLQALGKDGAKLADRLLEKAQLDMDKLLKITDTKTLLKTIESQDLYIQAPGKPDKFPELRERPLPQAAPKKDAAPAL